MRSEVFGARKAVQRETWLWIALLATGMIVGAVLVGLVALTSVVLPYDQEFVRLTSRQLAAMNPRLLPFMVHDRVTLAGIMLSIGILYGQLALHALRKGEYWAMLPVAVSGAVGFASFFLFLGFGYFDPLHATVSAILFVYFLLGLRAWLRETGWRRTFFPSARRWRDVACPHLMEKALLLLAAVGIVVGGLTIAFLGVTTVFVPEDIAFLQATPATLHAMNERLISLIAHDRAGFGGALVSDGLGILLATWGGFRPGARWLWWTLLGAGVSAFVPAIGIHLIVGYTTFSHLAPAVAGGLFYAVGLACTYPVLCKVPPSVGTRYLCRKTNLIKSNHSSKLAGVKTTSAKYSPLKI